MPIEKEKPSREELRKLRGVVAAHGIEGATRILGIHREPLTRLLADVPVRAGTVHLLRHKLAESEFAGNVDGSRP